MARISQRAGDDIISFEVSSRTYYEKHYEHPEWPGESSGDTIAIGYDLGYASLAKLHNDWDGRIDAQMIKVMEQCVGIHGDAARQLLPRVRSEILIPWQPACDVFYNRDVPEWTEAVIKAIPKAEQLPPDCLGSIVSCAYNRGASFDHLGNRYTEMRAIKQFIQNGQLSQVGGALRSMKRLWPNSAGLRARRDVEAQLWEEGLKVGMNVPTISNVNPAPQSRMPTQTPTAAHGTSGGVVVATAGAAKQAASSGMPGWEIAAIVAGGVIVAAGAYYIISKTRGQPLLARGKDQPITTATTTGG